MWSALKDVLTPTDLDEALHLASRPGHRLVGGGSHLVDEQPAKVHTLVAIRALLSHTIDHEKDRLVLGAGVCLADLLEYARSHGLKDLARALQAACPEPNLRQQRLLGGSLVHERLNGVIPALCVAARATIQLHETDSPTPFAGWNGTGLVTALQLPLAGLAFAAASRLPASAPWLFAVRGGFASHQRFCAGGGQHAFQWADHTTGSTNELAARLAQGLPDDSLGRREYKARVLVALLEDLEAQP